jgi:hypothetical protein
MVFSTFEFERELAARMHVRDKLVMANGVLLTYDFPAHGLDVLGTETNWFPNGRWGPMSDEELLFKRALAFQRPYCFLMNAHYADLTPELVERYMQRSLFYGMFPGFFSENAATHCYFESPEWYDAARPLFKKYVPLVRRIAQAGWQPVTHARASVEGLLLERYGDPSQSAVYLTALNDTADPITATVNVDLRALGWSGKNVLARDLLADTDVRTTCDAERLSYDVTLAAQTVALAFLSAEP